MFLCSDIIGLSFSEKTMMISLIQVLYSNRKKQVRLAILSPVFALSRPYLSGSP